MTDTVDFESEYGISPYQLHILSKKFEMATREMSQVLMKSARSGVISMARDFSSGFTLYDGRQFIIDEGLPVHTANIRLTPEYIMEHFDDIEPGDCFLTNSHFAGCTHHADYTLSVPVFVDGEPLFWSINRAHQADIGAPEPTTYPTSSENIYQEGPHFPAVRIQEDYEDRDDLVRMLKLNLRLGDKQWIADYRGQVAAVRRGEERIQEICDEYGVDTVESFADAWLAYGERMMRENIASLPDRSFEYSAFHDPIPGAPDGVEVTVGIDVDPDAREMTVDLTDNMENVPSGFNLSRATSTAGVFAGIFNNLSGDIPHNHGAIEPIEVVMDKGKIVGEPTYPVSAAVATTNVCQVLINAVQAAFSNLGEPFGLSEATSGTLNYPVIYGEDPRRDDQEYINELFFLGGGGPAGAGYDGWLIYSSPSGGSVPNRDSLELDEQKYPILFEQSELRADTEGAGKWRGAHGSINRFRPLGNPLQLSYMADNREYPAQGVLGGKAARRAELYAVDRDGERRELPGFGVQDIDAGETVVIKNSGAGGYGDPLDRDPDLVLKDVERDLVSKERAREEYGVVIDEQNGNVRVDDARTKELRRDRRTEGAE